jgi:hypothetical protein
MIVGLDKSKWVFEDIFWFFILLESYLIYFGVAGLLE